MITQGKAFTFAQQKFVTQSNNFNCNRLNIELSKVALNVGA